MVMAMKSVTAGDKKARTHDLILDTAARAIRRGGYAGISVADLMKEAGLTHGGFYAHFASRNAMLAEAMDRAAKRSAEAIAPKLQQAVTQGKTPFRALVEQYLSDEHLADAEQGCPIAALGSEICRQPDEVRAVAVRQMQSLRDAISRALPADIKAEQANVVMATLVGSLQLARAYGDTAEGRSMLAQSRASLLQQFDHVKQ